MKLYMVLSSFNYEGGTMHGVFKTRKGALNCKQKLDRYEAGDYTNVIEIKTGKRVSISVPYDSEGD